MKEIILNPESIPKWRNCRFKVGSLLGVRICFFYVYIGENKPSGFNTEILQSNLIKKGKIKNLIQ